jgi:beta-glucosidase-like glycosyl hydrolase
VAALPENRQTARWAAQRSMVLLKNEGGLLPLSKEQKNIAVIGPLADSMEATEGSWMVFGHQPAAAANAEGIISPSFSRKRESSKTISFTGFPLPRERRKGSLKQMLIGC